MLLHTTIASYTTIFCSGVEYGALLKLQILPNKPYKCKKLPLPRELSDFVLLKEYIS